MKKVLPFLCFCLFLFAHDKTSAQTTIQVFDTLLFYDGYAATVTYPIPAGVIRQRNDLFTRKLTDQELQSIGTNLTMNIVIKAACDNYDRIGRVNLAFVPKGDTTYIPDSVPHIEVGRYITPFMDKNVMPDTVPYTYTTNNMAGILKDSSINAMYDIWVELQLFGVPYSANTQIAGCAGRSDVFYGSLQFVTNTASPPQTTNLLSPLLFQFDLNNYKAGSTDTIGKTTKTVNFNLPFDLTDAAFFIVTSAHGSNSGGEEYNRRHYYIYSDNNQVLTYVPGSLTCEPFRVYNTEPNGIYQSSPQPPSYWQSFSNWCPGDVIPIRTVDLGPLAAGNHSFRIDVPDAVFTGGQGTIPLSVYLQGKTEGTLGVNINELTDDISEVNLFPNPATGLVTIRSENKVERADIFNLFGQKVLTGAGEKINVATLAPGVYTIQIYFIKDELIIKKLIKD